MPSGNLDDPPLFMHPGLRFSQPDVERAQRTASGETFLFSIWLMELRSFAFGKLVLDDEKAALVILYVRKISLTSESVLGSCFASAVIAEPSVMQACLGSRNVSLHFLDEGNTCSAKWPALA